MTPTKDQDGPESGDISSEITKTMAEAEAALDAMGDEMETESEETGIEIEAPDDEESRVAALTEELASTKDKWLRAVADLDNYRKRVKREMDDAVVRKTQSLLSGFLPTVDNLERALEIAGTAMEEASDENESNVSQVLKGIGMVRDEFLGALKKQGIEPVVAVGVAFDPAIHDALQQMDSPDHPPGVVIREFEKGYKMGERLLRPARVIVAGAGSTGGEA
ncbi:MAG: nucleotide exchange factor GrpE [Myxococcota bacterium]